MAAGEYLHFRCDRHKVDGHFESKPYEMPAKCGVIGCRNRGKPYWYKGEKYANLPYEINYSSWLASGMG